MSAAKQGARTPTAAILQFTVVDKFGTTVNATAQCWNVHILPHRQHLVGQEQLVKEAISDPLKVLQGNTPDSKEFWGKPQPGNGFQWGGVMVVATVKYLQSGNGILTTAYTTSGSVPPGIQLWP